MYITAKFQEEGWHHWPEAPNYLVFPHRHIFHFTIKMAVTEANRQVEFIDFKREWQNFIRDSFAGTEQKPMHYSCEQIGLHLAKAIFTKYNSEVSVWVEEDGENGAIVSTEDLEFYE